MFYIPLRPAGTAIGWGILVVAEVVAVWPVAVEASHGVHHELAMSPADCGTNEARGATCRVGINK
jgi:hypothetical protein